MKMKNCFKIVFGVAGLLLATTFAGVTFAQSPAQDQSTPPAASQPAHKHGDRFAGLNLTDDQKAQIKKVREEAKAKSDAIMADSSLSEADKKAQVRAIRMDARKQTREVLTPEQRKQLKAKMQERRAARSQTRSMSM
jgi:periplasmic protein CpxP/Spy